MLALSLVPLLLASVSPNQVLVTLTTDPSISAADRTSLEEVLSTSVRHDPAFQPIADVAGGAVTDPTCALAANVNQPRCVLSRAQSRNAQAWLSAVVTRFADGYALKVEGYDVSTGKPFGSSTRTAPSLVALSGHIDEVVADVMRFAPRPPTPFEPPAIVRAPLELVAALGLSVATAYGSYKLAHAAFDSHDCPDYVTGCEGSFIIGAAGAASGAAAGTIAVGSLLHGHGSWLWASIGGAAGLVPAYIAWKSATKTDAFFGYTTLDESYFQAAVIGASPALGAVLGYELSAALRPEPSAGPTITPVVSAGPSGGTFALVGTF